MTRKQSLSALALVFAVVAGVALTFNFSSKPEFVSDAQGRLESYLSYSYGPLNCSSAKANGNDWEISCDATDEQHKFVYAVHDGADNPFGFVLTAMNDGAKESRDVDLVSLLGIKTSVN
jgi:hypothetical protein